VREQLYGKAGWLVLTTPNAFRYQAALQSLRGQEIINSDHRYWFSPYTLAKVMWRAGYRDIRLHAIWAEKPRPMWKGRLKGLIGGAVPAMRDVLVAEARLRPSAGRRSLRLRR
jgi:hypothetical protein